MEIARCRRVPAHGLGFWFRAGRGPAIVIRIGEADGRSGSSGWQVATAKIEVDLLEEALNAAKTLIECVEFPLTGPCYLADTP